MDDAQTRAFPRDISQYSRGGGMCSQLQELTVVYFAAYGTPAAA
jgi:hypothetical protein